jgi:hypothetical protein
MLLDCGCATAGAPEAGAAGPVGPCRLLIILIPDWLAVQKAQFSLADNYLLMLLDRGCATAGAPEAGTAGPVGPPSLLIIRLSGGDGRQAGQVIHIPTLHTYSPARVKYNYVYPCNKLIHIKKSLSKISVSETQIDRESKMLFS